MMNNIISSGIKISIMHLHLSIVSVQTMMRDSIPGQIMVELSLCLFKKAHWALIRMKEAPIGRDSQMISGLILFLITWFLHS